MLAHNLKHIEDSIPHIAELALGGTAVGTGLNTHPEYAVRVAKALAELTHQPFVTAPNKFEALATCDALVWAWRERAGGFADEDRQRRALAGVRPALRHRRDFDPGERTGQLHHAGQGQPDPVRGDDHAVRPVLGNDVAVNIGGASGNFELNVFRPMVIHNYLQSIRLLADGMQGFNEHCAVASNRTAIASPSC